MRTVEKGDLAVAMLTARFLRLRHVVLKPISEMSRYDLVIDRGSGFERIQCKMGRLRNGAVSFNTCSSTLHHANGSRKAYTGEIESFGVYCADNDHCYLVPVDHVGVTEGKLRIERPKNNQSAGVRMASDYAL